MTRVVGLIGGMSWQTTAVYYKEINNHVRVELGGVHSADIIIRSVDYSDIARMVSTGDFDNMVAMLSQRSQELQRAGAQCLVLCANVAHKAYDALVETSGLPVLHIVDAAAGKIISDGHRKVGLIATRAVMEESFYKSRFTEMHKLQVAVPGADFRAVVDRMVFEELSKETIADEVRQLFQQTYNRLIEEEKVDCIVLACTELRLVYTKDDFTVPTYETTALHAESIAQWALVKE